MDLLGMGLQTDRGNNDEFKQTEFSFFFPKSKLINWLRNRSVIK